VTGLALQWFSIHLSEPRHAGVIDHNTNRRAGVGKRPRRLCRHFGDRVVLAGHPEARLPNTLIVSFVGSVGAEILAWLEGVAASTGSVCHAGGSSCRPCCARSGWHPKSAPARSASAGRATSRDEIDNAVTRLRSVPCIARSRRRVTAREQREAGGTS
jgi:cysteine sulfinate desulfinase/cysteine desulfurase-like protein